MIIAEREGAVLRHAREEDLSAVDALTVAGYAAIQESFVAMLGEDLYDAVQADPGQTWKQRKAAQNLLARAGPQLRPSRQQRRRRATRGPGLGDVHVPPRARPLPRARAALRACRHGLDDAHIPARRAYEAVGCDRSVPTVDLWRRL